MEEMQSVLDEVLGPGMRCFAQHANLKVVLDKLEPWKCTEQQIVRANSVSEAERRNLNILLKDKALYALHHYNKGGSYWKAGIETGKIFNVVYGTDASICNSINVSVL